MVAQGGVLTCLWSCLCHLKGFWAWVSICPLVVLSAMAFQYFRKYLESHGVQTAQQFLPRQSEITRDLLPCLNGKDMFILGFTGLTRGVVPGFEGCILLAISDPRLPKKFVFLGLLGLYDIELLKSERRHCLC